VALHSVTPGQWRLVALSGLLGAAGAVAAVASTELPDPMRLPPALMFVVVTVMFAVTESAKFHVEVRQQALSVSLTALPLVVGLYTLDLEWVLVARLMSAATVLHLRQQPVHKTLFNLSLYTLEVGLAFLLRDVVVALWGDPESIWVHAVAIVLVVDLVGVLAVVLAMTVLGGRPGGRAVAVMMASVLLSGVLSATIASLTLTALENGSEGLLLLAIISAAVVVAFRQYAKLVRQHADLGEVLGAARTMGQAQTSDDLASTLTAEAANLVSATGAELWLLRDPMTVTLLPATGAQAVVVRSSTRDPLERAWLVERGWRDAIVLPIDVGEEVPAVLVTYDRQGSSLSTFSDDDLDLLQTLATHAAVVWQNNDLVARLRHDSHHDDLTTLPNRLAFSVAVTRVLTSREPGQDDCLAAVMLLDLDRFREVNDTLGHPVGDILLVQVARRLSESVPRGATVARLGGDEFAILLPEVRGREEVERVADSLAAAMITPFDLNGTFVDVSASLGLVGIAGSGGDAATVLRHADVAMYEAKRKMAAYCWYEPQRDRTSLDRLTLVGDLRRAIDEETIDVEFQPQLSLRDNRVTGFEALARWTHPERGPIPPAEFVPLADHTGQVGMLTTLALRKALAHCARFSGHAFGVSVNLPTRLLLEPGLPDQVRQLLDEAGVHPGRLTLELTEDSVMSYQVESLRPMHALRDLGVRLSVDDFGTGYSSLAYLRHLPIHEVKIDKTFIIGMGNDRGARSIVSSVINLSHDLGLEVVAEGVEDHATLLALTDAGCDIVQGYLLGRPMPAHQVGSWLATRHLPR
jgi:diguanylate cyclase (GGDEF)-like protein